MNTYLYCALILLGLLAPQCLAVVYDSDSLLDDDRIVYPRTEQFTDLDLTISHDYPNNLAGTIEAVKELSTNNGSYVKSAKLDKSIQLFLSVAEVVEKCDLDSFKTLMGAYQSATFGRLYLEPTDRISTAVLEALEKHAELCLPKYLDRYQQAISGMDQSAIEKVNNLLSDDLIEQAFPGQSKLDILKEERVLSQVQSQAAVAMLNKLQDLSRESRRSQATMDKGTMEKHFIEPCQYYVEHLEAVFYPVRLDTALDEARLKLVGSEQEIEPFMDSWIKFRICDSLIKNPSKALTMIKKALRRSDV